MTSITKRDLKQYRSMRREIMYLRTEIARSPRLVSDSVSGSAPDFPYIEGIIPIRGADMRKREHQRARLQEITERCEAVDRFIEAIESSDIRMYIILRYVEGQSWMQVVTNMGNDVAPETARVAVWQYLKENIESYTFSNDHQRI